MNWREKGLDMCKWQRGDEEGEREREQRDTGREKYRKWKWHIDKQGTCFCWMPNLALTRKSSKLWFL